MAPSELPEEIAPQLEDETTAAAARGHDLTPWEDATDPAEAARGELSYAATCTRCEQGLLLTFGAADGLLVSRTGDRTLRSRSRCPA